MPKIISKIIFVTLLIMPVSALAKIEYKLTTPIPGLTELNSVGDIGSYIATLFQFGLAIVGLVAFGSIVFHGIKYVAGGANESLVSDAREGITQAILGLLLLIGAVTILDTINPCILQTVNLWRSRDTITSICKFADTPNVNEGGIEIFTQEEYNREESTKNGTSVILGTNLTITGVTADDKLKRISIKNDGSYEVFVPDEEGVWTESGTVGSNIHDDFTTIINFPDINDKNQDIQTKLRSLLVSAIPDLSLGVIKNSYLLADLKVTGNANSDFNFEVSGATDGAGTDVVTVNEYSSCTIKGVEFGLPAYWRCSIAIRKTTGAPLIGENDELKYFYLDQFPNPANKDNSTTVIRENYVDLVKSIFLQGGL